MTLDARARVMLVDDHPLVRLGLAQLLEHERDLVVCAQAASIAEALPLLREHDPDVLVLDLQLRDGNALDALRGWLAELPHLAVLVLSMHDQRIYAERCLRAGARGYLMKEEAAANAVAAIRAIAAGGSWVSPQLRDEPAGRLPLELLSDRELQVFELIGDGLPVRAIAERLGLGVKTVETHKANIKRKLGIEHAGEVARLAMAWRELGGRSARSVPPQVG